MTYYKIIRIEKNKPETVLELTEENYGTLLDAWQSFEHHMIDSEPYADQDIEEWEKSYADYNELDKKLSKFIRN